MAIVCLFLTLALETLESIWYVFYLIILISSRVLPRNRCLFFLTDRSIYINMAEKKLEATVEVFIDQLKDLHLCIIKNTIF